MKNNKYTKRNIKDLIEEIKQKVSIREVVFLYGISCGTHKNQYHCPFHGEDKRPSASISKGFFHCFTCNHSWAVVDFVCKMENISKWNSINLLNDRFNLALFKPLSYSERLQFIKKEKERIKKKKMEQECNKFELETLKKILSRIKEYNIIEKNTHPTRKQIRENSWSNEAQSKFFDSFKQRFRLDWLYCKICGLYFKECEYDFIYQGLSKIELLRKIYKNEIKI